METHLKLRLKSLSYCCVYPEPHFSFAYPEIEPSFLLVIITTFDVRKLQDPIPILKYKKIWTIEYSIIKAYIK